MKDFIVRLKDFNGNIIDGEMYKAKNKYEAVEQYKKRIKKLCISVCIYDHISVEEVD